MKGCLDRKSIFGNKSYNQLTREKVSVLACRKKTPVEREDRNLRFNMFNLSNTG